MTATTRKPPTAKATTVVVPDDAKQPQDHKPKAEPKATKPTVEQTEAGRVVTYKGFSVIVPDDALDDFELLGELREMQESEDATVFPALLRRLVGPAGYRTVMDGLRNPDTGRVTVLDGAEYLQTIFEALAPNS